MSKRIPAVFLFLLVLVALAGVSFAGGPSAISYVDQRLRQLGLIDASGEPTGGGSAPTKTTWTSPITTWTNNVTWTGYYYQSGGLLFGHLRGVLTGTPTDAVLTFTLPEGKVIDFTAVSASGCLSSGSAFDQSNVRAGFILLQQSSTQLTVYVATGVNTYSAVARPTPFTWQSGDSLNLYFTVPVVQ